MQNTRDDIATLLGRILLAVIFIWSGYGKIVGYAATVGYMEKFGVPGMMLPLVIALELAGGVLLVIGWQTKYVAIALAVFTVVAGILFHGNFGDRGQMIHFTKNLAIAGGFLALFVSGPGRWSLDGRKA